jgi:pantothenate synthetase
VDYVEVVDSRSMQPVARVAEGSTLIAVAALFGSVRLIDNLEF